MLQTSWSEYGFQILWNSLGYSAFIAIGVSDERGPLEWRCVQVASQIL